MTAGGRRPLVLTGVRLFLLAGSRVGRWLRRRKRAWPRSWIGTRRDPRVSRRCGRKRGKDDGGDSGYEDIASRVREAGHVRGGPGRGAGRVRPAALRGTLPPANPARRHGDAAPPGGPGVGLNEWRV